LTISSLARIRTKFRDVVHRDVVGQLCAAAEDGRGAFLAHAIGQNLIDPDLHEGRRPQHHVRHAAALDRVLDVPLDPEVVDHGELIHAAERHEHQAADAGVARRGAEVLIGGEVDLRRAGRARAHDVVGGGDDLADPAARLGQFGQVHHVDCGDFGAGLFERRQLRGVTAERAHGHACGKELAGDHAAEQTGGAGDQHTL
jgi:hypothetical protein